MSSTVSINRIDEMFARCREERRAALILYLTSGFPDEATTRRLLPILEEAGCDLIELGVPFSDPIADGPTIQKSSTVALENGITVKNTFSVLRDFRRTSSMPIVLFGALNPFLHQGLTTCVESARDAGADGFLIPDFPVEEASEFRELCAGHGLHLVSFIAPTSPDERIARIADASSGFVYCFALKGITGARAAISENVFPYLEKIRARTDLPRALGFGISKPEHVAAVAPHCEAVVVGSALISLVDNTIASGGDLETVVGDYVKSMADATKRPAS